MRRVAFATALCGLLLQGCAAANVGHPPVPAPLSEQIPLPPVSAVQQVWRPGDYDWNGTDYSWVPGQWLARGDHGLTWQDGHWDGVNAAAVWIPGHWL